MENKNKTKEQLLEEIEQLKIKFSESESKSRLWLENSPVCTKIVDLDFNLQYMSASGVRELKIDDITEFYGKPYPLHFYPDSFKIPMTKNLKRAKETGETITQEAPIVDIKGNTLWYHSTIVPVYNDKGQLDYILVVSLETTERKQAEEELLESNEKYLNLMDSLGTGVILHAPDTSIILSNPKASEILGITHEQMQGKKAIDPQWKFVRNDGTDMPLEEYPVNKALSLMKSFSEYFIGIKHPDRKYITWVNVNASLVFDENKNIKYVTISFNDITERKQAEKELENHRKHLEELVRERTAELNEKNQKLSDQMKVFVGRELKIRDLEKIIRELKEKD